MCRESVRECSENATDALPQDSRRRMDSPQSVYVGVAVESRLAHVAEGQLEGHPVEQLLAAEQDSCLMLLVPPSLPPFGAKLSPKCSGSSPKGLTRKNMIDQLCHLRVHKTHYTVNVSFPSDKTVLGHKSYVSR